MGTHCVYTPHGTPHANAPLSHYPKVNHVSFATEFLPHFLGTHYPWLGAEQAEALLAPWRAGTHLDAPTFSSFLEALVSDLAFFRAQANSA